MDEASDRVDLLVLGTVNAALKRRISAEALAHCLRSGDVEPWLVHVAAFFTEVSPNLVLAFARRHGVEQRHLERLYDRITDTTGLRNERLEAFLDALAHAP